MSSGSGTYWLEIDNIRAEWPEAMLNSIADLQGYRRTLEIYEEHDDYHHMMECANGLAKAMAHSLYGPGLLHGADLANAVHKTLYAALCPPPDGATLAANAQKAARLALTIAREHGWQPASLGGTNPLFDRLIMDRGNYALLDIAIAPPSDFFGGDMEAFFAIPPTIAER